jgi:hypothetical protein
VAEQIARFEDLTMLTVFDGWGRFSAFMFGSGAPGSVVRKPFHMACCASCEAFFLRSLLACRDSRLKSGNACFLRAQRRRESLVQYLSEPSSGDTTLRSWPHAGLAFPWQAVRRRYKMPLNRQ